jgi:hypothetical protein
MIDIIVYYDKKHQILFDYFFYPSFIENEMQKNFNLIQKKIIEKKTEGCGVFESSYWSKVIIDRFDILKQYVSENPGKWAIFSDIDILFIKNIYNITQNVIQNANNKKIFYMAENFYGNQVNGGFFLFNCCEEIFNWFDSVQKECLKMKVPNDQTYINSIVHNYPMVNLLPRRNFCCNNNKTSIYKSLIDSNTMEVFHATSTYNITHKINVLSSVQIFLKRHNIPYSSSNIPLIPNLWKHIS